MGWQENFQSNIDQWNLNVGVAKENLENITNVVQSFGLETKPADQENTAPVKESEMTKTLNLKMVLFVGAGIILLVVLLKKGGGKSLLSGL